MLEKLKNVYIHLNTISVKGEDVLHLGVSIQTVAELINDLSKEAQQDGGQENR